jgi:hypothetical protein
VITIFATKTKISPLPEFPAAPNSGTRARQSFETTVTKHARRAEIASVSFSGSPRQVRQRS